MVDARITKCLTAKRESKTVEFKEQFVPTDPRQSLEVLKDIVAISNCGGGTLAVGINNAGEATGADVTAALDYDHAKYCDLIRKYTNQNFSDFEILEAEKDGQKIAIFLIDPPDYPLIFEKPGTYPIEGNKHQQTAFAQRTLFSATAPRRSLPRQMISGDSYRHASKNSKTNWSKECGRFRKLLVAQN